MTKETLDCLFEAALQHADPEVSAAIDSEIARQRCMLDLVASESVPPRAVLEAQGSVLTAKYADGYPGNRDYDTCEWVDEIERLAIERAKALFGADHANVQPYSGSSANAAVLHALCEPGDVVLGFDFAHGGHPTQCGAETFAGRNYRALGIPRAARRPARGHGRGRGARPPPPPEGPVRRLVVLHPPPGLRAVPCHRRRGKRCPGGRHGPFCGPGCCQGAP